jgi:hypothetical protein
MERAEQLFLAEGLRKPAILGLFHAETRKLVRQEACLPHSGESFPVRLLGHSWSCKSMHIAGTVYRANKI